MGPAHVGVVAFAAAAPARPRRQVSSEKPFTYYGAQAIFRRIKARSGVQRVHAHLLRHTFAQVALEKGAPRAETARSEMPRKVLA